MMKDEVEGGLFIRCQARRTSDSRNTLVGLTICLLVGQWSAELFSEIQFVLGSLLFVIGLLDAMSTKRKMADYDYQFSRPAGQSSLEERTSNDILEVNKSYSGLLIFSISGSLIIGMGLGIYKIFG